MQAREREALELFICAFNPAASFWLQCAEKEELVSRGMLSPVSHSLLLVTSN